MAEKGSAFPTRNDTRADFPFDPSPLEQRPFFKKEERLTSRKVIDLLFREKGNSCFIFPLRLSWIKVPLNTPFPAQVLITVSRKKFRSAVQRNRVKRQLREVYRKNKGQIYELLSSEKDKFALSLAYVSDLPVDGSRLEESFHKLVQRFKQALN